MYYQDILKDAIIIIVVVEYAKIDKINKTPFCHGVKHVTNVSQMMITLVDLLNISTKVRESLLIAYALHDK